MRKCIRQRWAIGAIAAMSWLCAGSNISRAAIAFYYDANAVTPAPDPTTFAGGTVDAHDQRHGNEHHHHARPGNRHWPELLGSERRRAKRQQVLPGERHIHFRCRRGLHQSGWLGSKRYAQGLVLRESNAHPAKLQRRRPFSIFATVRGFMTWLSSTTAPTNRFTTCRVEQRSTIPTRSWTSISRMDTTPSRFSTIPIRPVPRPTSSSTAARRRSLRSRIQTPARARSSASSGEAVCKARRRMCAGSMSIYRCCPSQRHWRCWEHAWLCCGGRGVEAVDR